MGDESPQNAMNLDLNLEPVVHPSQDDQPQTMSLDDWLDGSMTELISMRDSISHRPRARQRLRSVWRPIPIPMEARNTALGLTSSSGLVTEERNADDDDDERPSEMIKTNDSVNKHLEIGNVGKGDIEKRNGDEGSFFDCNICLDLASDPVVTCCGHLFCWPCLYRWLFVHSDAKECPICKGEVTMKTITPIYSRGNRTRVTEVDPSVKIPSRPHANRIESWRHSIERNVLSMPMFEMIRRLDNRLDPTRNTIADTPRETPLLNRIFTSRGMRRGQDAPPAPTVSPDATADSSPEPGGSTHRNRDATIPSLTSGESFVESYFHNHPDERNQEQTPLMDDRHSMSSIAAILQTESQTADTAAETDSRVSVSTSRRRCESSTSRVSDVDSGDSHTRRRRLQ